jgi:general secretion pathway protein F
MASETYYVIRMPSRQSRPLAYRIRAELFTQLARLEAAGLPYDRAVAAISLRGAAARRLRAMQAMSARGLDAARAGQESGLFTPLEARLIRAALNAGSPAATYQRLAQHYTQRAMQWSAMKSRLTLPASMLVLALLVPPLPALVTGSITVAGYAWQVAWPLLSIAILVMALRWLGNQDASSRGKSFYQRVPLYGPIFVRGNLRDFFESLALMLQAGVPMLDALPPAIETVSDGDIRRELARVRQRVERQETLAAALDGVPYLRDSRAVAFAQAGEQSGTLPEMLLRHAAMETEAIDQFFERLSTWLPRVVYLLVAIKIAAGILSSPIMAPRVPPDL